jgi:hypothetical protein
VYGPVRTVVWEGRSREAPPYPDSILDVSDGDDCLRLVIGLAEPAHDVHRIQALSLVP